MAEHQAFATKLAPTPLFPEKPDARVLALQHWYPRVWMNGRWERTARSRKASFRRKPNIFCRRRRHGKL
jgi:hypothetical protein